MLAEFGVDFGEVAFGEVEVMRVDQGESEGQDMDGDMLRFKCCFEISLGSTLFIGDFT